MNPKKKIYDKEIHPLLERIVEICKENEIGMLTSFRLDEKDETDLHTGLSGGNLSGHQVFCRLVLEGQVSPDKILTLLRSTESLPNKTLKFND